jgi:hypothetical protein
MFPKQYHLISWVSKMQKILCWVKIKAFKIFFFSFPFVSHVGFLHFYLGRICPICVQEMLVILNSGIFCKANIDKINIGRGNSGRRTLPREY